jgi:hypothetical protein
MGSSSDFQKNDSGPESFRHQQSQTEYKPPISVGYQQNIFSFCFQEPLLCRYHRNTDRWIACRSPSAAPHLENKRNSRAEGLNDAETRAKVASCSFA